MGIASFSLFNLFRAAFHKFDDFLWKKSQFKTKLAFLTNSSVLDWFFGQLAWAWLKMSFATFRAYYPTYRNPVMFDLNYLFQSFSRPH